jgi:hypothetical protein
MGHYSDAYERDEDARIEAEKVERAKLLERIKRDLAIHDLPEILVSIIKGEYK